MSTKNKTSAQYGDWLDIFREDIKLSISRLDPRKEACNTIFGQAVCEPLLEEGKASLPAIPQFIFQDGALKAKPVEAGQKQGGVSRASDFLGKSQPKKKVGFTEALGGHVRTLGMVNRR